MGGTFPLLTRLTISQHPTGELPFSFHNAPNLRDVYSPRCHTARPNPKLPWSQLTTFRADTIDLALCIRILHSASNLRDATFHITDIGPLPLPNHLPPLNHLQSLTVGGIEYPGAATAPLSILEGLTTPALQKLTLMFPYFKWVTDISPFLSFASRSSFQLQALTMSFMPTTTEILIQCLDAIPSLLHLKIQPGFHVDMNTIFAQLTGNVNFLPRLESLHVILTQPVPLTQAVPTAALIGMLSWRWGSVRLSRLRSFQFAYTCTTTPAFDEDLLFHPDFRRLKEEGMVLYIGKIRPVIDSFPAPRPEHLC